MTAGRVAVAISCVGIACALVGVVLGAGGASSSNSLSAVGNPGRGKQLLRSYGCGACHIIPGIRTARGLVGPPLSFYGDRTIIAGQLPNTSANLIRWIQHPEDVDPKTAMPDLGVSEQQAGDMTAYLYTLHRRGDFQ